MDGKRKGNTTMGRNEEGKERSTEERKRGTDAGKDRGKRTR